MSRTVIASAWIAKSLEAERIHAVRVVCRNHEDGVEMDSPPSVPVLTLLRRRVLQSQTMTKKTCGGGGHPPGLPSFIRTSGQVPLLRIAFSCRPPWIWLARRGGAMRFSVADIAGGLAIGRPDTDVFCPIICRRP